MKILRPAAVLMFFTVLPLLFMWKLTLAGRILVGGDPFNFFYPYHDGVVAALRDGRLPEWNPYLFGGVPFLADSQAQFFYPAAWLFRALDAPAALTWSSVFHIAVAGTGLYGWSRHGFRLSPLAALAAALIFALGGYLGAQVEHVNQVAAAAWLPWMFWGYDTARSAPGERPAAEWARIRAAGMVGGALSLALSLLAGHAQTTFMGLLLAGLWALALSVSTAKTRGQPEPERRRAALRGIWLPLIGLAGLGAMISGVQLLPTQNLSTLSPRAGGLEFREAAAFSFDPRVALRAFFPTYGLDDPLLSEYVAWTGFGGLALALLGAWRGGSPARAFGLLSAVTGILLALGAFNPLFWLLWRVAPGFDLFRVPARWLLLWALGAAILAGAGLEALTMRLSNRKGGRLPESLVERVRALSPRGVLALLLLGAAAGVYALLGDLPRGAVLPYWLLSAAVTILLLRLGTASPAFTRRSRAGALWVLWIAIELWLGSWGLDYQNATAAEAYSGMRTTIAHLLVMNAPESRHALPPEQQAVGRILSMSGLTWDPGDLVRLQERHMGELPEEAVYDLVVSTKLKELLAPNQPMRWGIPSADGYGGGLLPSARWVEFQTVLPLAKQVPDGRLREQLTAVPRRELLDVMGVEWLVADKVMDWWSDGIYHDLGAPRSLQPGEIITFLPPAGGAFMPFDVLSFVVHGVLPPDAGAVLVDGRTVSLNGAEERSVRTTPSGDERHYLLPLGERVLSAPAIEVRTGKAGWTLAGVTLWNSQLKGFEALAAEPAFVTTLSGDLKVYRRRDYRGRAWFAPTARFVPDAERAAAAMGTEEFDLSSVALVEEQRDVFEQYGDRGAIRWKDDRAERLELEVASVDGGWLVVADAPFPGWTVTIDGVGAEWYPANVINRAVFVPAGAHTVVWRYETPGLRWGAAATFTGLLLAAFIALRALRR